MAKTRTVVYAIPPKVKQPVRHNKKTPRVVTISPNKGWSNAQLLKDCDVIPYLLHKNHHCDASMVGGKNDSDYSNQQYVKGMQLEFLPDGSLQTRWNYLAKHWKQIDCLLLYGPYRAYISLADCYKSHNPNGKICLALDANSWWMDRIQWAEPDFRRFMDQCDVITVAGRTMQRHLNEKWPWAVEFIPNGFYNFSSTPWAVDFDKKENIILTAARLGTPEKANDIMLEAFAKIAGQIPGWELHLAGGIEDSFQEWLKGFRERHPELTGRIRFLGEILDRDELYGAYRRSKIFALSSIREGGTPNVIAEALFSGCAIACTKIDEWRDATNNGRCGLAAEIRSVDSFADILLRLCQSERLDEMCRDAYAYAQEVYDMERISHVEQLPALSFLACDFGNSGLQNHSFDVVVLNGLTDFPQPYDVLKDAVSLAKTDGALFCYSHDTPLLENVFKLFFETRDEYEFAPSRKVMAAEAAQCSWQEKVVPSLAATAGEDLARAAEMPAEGSCNREECVQMLEDLQRDIRTAVEQGETALKIQLLAERERLLNSLIPDPRRSRG